MARLVAVISLLVAALALPAWAQNEGPCAFDFECGDVGKCIKTNPNDTIGKCALAEGVSPDSAEDDEAPEPSIPDRQSARQEPAPVKSKECLIHLECGFGNLCYKKPLSLKGTCGPGKPSVLGELLGGDESLGRGQKRSGDRAETCSFDTECDFDNVCYKELGQITGTCGPKRTSRDGRIWDGDARDDGRGGQIGGKGEKCVSDSTCGYGFRCFMATHELEGVCGRSNSELGRDDTFGGSWDDRRRRDQLRDMEQMLGRACMQDRECGPGLRCATVRGSKECVLP